MHPADGYDVVLTIDATVQRIAEQALAELAAKYHPAKASVILALLAALVSADRERFKE